MLMFSKSTMVNKTKQLAYWQGTFGNEYIKRNSDLSRFRKRAAFFKSVFRDFPDIKSILEVGCNIGGNLDVLHKINPDFKLMGLEPNKIAVATARKLVPSARIFEKSIFDSTWKNAFDLVFTIGVLIHIGDANLAQALRRIHTASRKYILTIEYFAQEKTVIPYRGLTDALFKRPFDKEWLALYPRLTLLKHGFLDASAGFDDCHWWLLKK
ncbi:TPA: hypothetical protein DIS61_03205 [Patescibacteria group bacterium]|nr:hypothetical protein [Patescibacteria group bacterium]